MNASIGVKRFRFFSGAAVCVLALVSLVSAQQPGPDRPGPQLPGRNRMGPPPLPGIQGARSEAERELRLARLLRQPEVQKALQITDEQRRKLEDIDFNSSKQAIQQRATLQVQQLELQRLLEADNPDRAAIDKKIQEVAQARAGLMRTETNALLDVRSVLTREQRDRIREYMQSQNRQRRQEQQRGRVGAPRPQGQGQPTPPQPPAPQR